MNKVGYAIFGTTKGLEVISNGLFKDLNIDGTLYLNTTSHTDLAINETVLLIKRIPTNPNNLERKDGVLIALYEYAGQNIGNRPGFIGSALCFKDKVPNADKIIQGLYFLFNKMKLNIDAKSKIKSGYATWVKTVLPNPNGNFGLFSTQQLSYTPLVNKTENLVVQLSNLRSDSISLLTHVCLNYSFHNINHLYASANTAVLNKLLKNGLKKINFLDVFNYNPSIEVLGNNLQLLSGQIRRLNEQQKKIDSEITNKNYNFRVLDAKYKDILTRIENKEKYISSYIEEEKKYKANYEGAKKKFDSIKLETTRLTAKIQNNKPKDVELAKLAVEVLKKHVSLNDWVSVEQFDQEKDEYTKKT